MVVTMKEPGVSSFGASVAVPKPNDDLGFTSSVEPLTAAAGVPKANVLAVSVEYCPINSGNHN